MGWIEVGGKVKDLGGRKMMECQDEHLELGRGLGKGVCIGR